ncbi:MAG: ATPase, T2SS/T4P/T4SS family [Planctomycetota bacterium]
MQFWLTDHGSNLRHTLEAEGDPINIGRDDACHITLRSPFVAPRHARILRRGNRMVVEALSQAGTRVANREVQKGSPRFVDFGDEIQIGQFTIAIVGRDGQSIDQPQADEQRLQDRLMELEQGVHAELLERMNLRVTGGIRKDDEAFLNQVLIHLDEVLGHRVATLDPDMVRLACRHHLRRLVTAEVVRQCQGKVQTEYQAGDQRLLDGDKERQIAELVTSLVDTMPLLFDPSSVSEDLAVAEDSFDELFAEQYPALDRELTRYVVQRTVAKDIQDIMLGLGPLTDLLAMPSVSEIMVVGPDRIYIEKNGVIQPTTRGFFSEEVLLSIIERILAPVGRRVDTSTPLVDARLADGSRVNAVIHPLSLVGPCLTIRKFGWVPFTMDDLVERDALSPNVARFLQGCIVGRANIVIAGGTGSGKTTLLNVLGAYARPSERIITVEESAELQLPQPHVVKLEGRPANVEGKGAYTIRELVRNSLRMRPDRIIVGEVRGPEALDMLQAMNTGHDGSLSTVHANNPHDAMKRLEALVLMAVEMPIRAIREQIVTAVDLVVQVTRFASGHRRVTAVSEVTDIDPETGQIRLEDVFTLKDPKQPRLRHTGYLPTFAEAMVQRGDFDVDVFL